MKDYLWEISASPYSSKFLETTAHFGTKPDVTLIDLYSGRHPSIIDAQFLTTGTRTFGTMASALLDSNLADELVRLANGQPVTEGFRKFFVFLTEKRWDFSLLFYYSEHFAKSGPSAEFFENATRRTEALLKLQAMDEARWLDSGEIIENPDAVEYYLENASASSMKELARNRVESFAAKSHVSATRNMMRAIEVSLAKMILLRRFEMKNASALEQWSAYREFLKNELGVLMGREALLALHYFHDLAGRLLGTQPNTRLDKALANLRSTAWDLYFLRFADQMFDWDGETLMLPYPATNERELANFAKLTRIERLMSDASGNLLPVVSYDLAALPSNGLAGGIDLGTGGAKDVAVSDALYDATVGRLSSLLPA